MSQIFGKINLQNIQVSIAIQRYEIKFFYIALYLLLWIYAMTKNRSTKMPSWGDAHYNIMIFNKLKWPYPVVPR